MPAKTYTDLLKSEEKYKDEVYKEFDRMRKDADDSVRQAQTSIRNGAYEAKEASLFYGNLADKYNRSRETESLVQALYYKPYFAHVEAKDDISSQYSEHYFLSDCETLDELVQIGDNGYLIPFKQDEKRPISMVLFHCYQAKRGEPIPYTTANGQYYLFPQLICDDTIEDRRLLKVDQLFPKTNIIQITADELLEEKLQQNRNDPRLQNIISTLQRQQFEIIEIDINKSFIVQGCAGSGKSQCLLHRLFFLRDKLSQNGWEHVLLLTPTQLFRNYSADLIRRYRLSSVKNCSTADLYQALLNTYDVRFKNRQYRFELTEEYLPDGYLHDVYDPSEMAKIDDEIQNAIRKYVSDGCNALGIDMPEQITIAQVNELVEKLDKEIDLFDKMESVLRNDKEYLEKKEQYEKLTKLLDTMRKRRANQADGYDKLLASNAELEKVFLAELKAEQDKNNWRSKCKAEQDCAIDELEKLAEQWDSSNDINLAAKYARQLAIVQDIFYGERHKAEGEYLQLLEDRCEQLRAALQEIAGDQPADRVYARYQKRRDELIQKNNQLDLEIERTNAQLAELETWLHEKIATIDGEKSKRRTLNKSDMDRARYFLSRIESTVFEQEVWNALTPLKKKYNIQTLQVEQQQDGRQKETKILYKSDVLFYLKIYAILHPNAKLPDYRIICIDEGQDLHKADYDILHKLYPHAVFNVFGDTSQVLHTACGIQSWKEDTGIKTEYTLNRNYRNTAAVVDFCNSNFGSNMEYIGQIREEQKPHTLSDITQVRMAVQRSNMTLIVKDHQTLEQLCAKINISISSFEYLDTKVDWQHGGKVPCYSIFAAKGLEFSNVMVYASGMTRNQKVVACTRAMEELYYYEQ